MVPLPQDFCMVNKVWFTHLHLLSATEAQVLKESSGSNASVPPFLWYWRIDNRVWGFSLNPWVIAPASASLVLALAKLRPSFFVLPALLIMGLSLVPGQRMKELPLPLMQKAVMIDC